MRKRMHVVVCVATMFGVGVGFGCSTELEDESVSVDALVASERVREIVENLHAAGFPDHEIEAHDDETVFVGGDAEVTLEASREMIGVATRGGERFEPEGDAFRQYRTNNLVSAAVDVICINGSAFTGTLSTGLDQAIANYNALNLRFDLVRTSGGNNGGTCDAQILAIRQQGGAGGSSGFPAGGLPYPQFIIGSGTTSYGVAVTRHVIQHEIGHTLGFRHSDYYNRSISCGSGGNEGNGGGAVHIPGTPTNATFNGSVMNACFNNGSNGTWTTSDVTALLALYAAGGAPPNPNSCVATNACGQQAPGGCWCDNLCAQFGDCCFDGPC